MSEEQLLNDVLLILDKHGALKSYQYLKDNLDNKQSYGSQVYNFLYCLASLAGLIDEALFWIKKAIIEKELWYRPEVFDDSDLDLIRNETVFTICKDISIQRYEKALEKAKIVTTWKKIKSDSLMLVLHGNQQNSDISKCYWQELEKGDYQIEYVQSGIVDSYKLYRWEDENRVQLEQIIKNISWNKYQTRILAGFSAGCNEILKTILLEDVKCEKLILIAPWISIIKTKKKDIIKALKTKKIKVMIICGSDDIDCEPFARFFENEINKGEVDGEVHWIDGLGHQYPSNLITLVNDYLNN